MFTFNNAEYKVVARTTNDFGEVAEIAINDNGELALRQFTYNAVGEPTDIKIKALDKSKTTIFQQGDFSLLFIIFNSLTLTIMITNIIKNIIKDIPSVANSKFDSVQLLPIGNKVELKVKTPKELTIVVSNIPQNTNSVTDYKKCLIVDTLIGSDMTLAELANEIDNIINSDVTLWDMKD